MVTVEAMTKKKSKIEKKMIIKSNINNIECSYYSEYYI